MYGIIGEDSSDVEMLVEIVKRLSGDERLSVKRQGFSGSGELFKKGKLTLQTFSRLRCSRFIVVYDSDGDSPDVRKRRIVEEIVNRSGVEGEFCALIPTQEIEAWILADIECVSRHFPGWRPTREFRNPENISNPKELLRSLSREGAAKPRYSNATHNPVLARYLDLDLVFSRCPSFHPLRTLVAEGKGNV
ncbi:DUF4276 family protein [Herbaspirillum rubrisubalbicans]|uniref:DUF4276 family protein n=1 Tax=Herbaspirillum rubrisubalbicans TaxID=80842 RepID=UPI003F536550